VSYPANLGSYELFYHIMAVQPFEIRLRELFPSVERLLCCDVRMTMKTPTLLAAACFAALFPAAAGAHQGSCMSEAFRVCWKAMPDEHSVFLCLLDNRLILHEPCRSKMMHEARRRMHHGVMDRSSHPRH
jgi:hypothetical protein